MPAYEQYLTEKNKIDGYINQQYLIANFKENLSGAWVDLEHPGGEKATLHLLTADARKYASSLLIKQQSIS
jgi:hypothetical protein